MSKSIITNLIIILIISFGFLIFLHFNLTISSANTLIDDERISHKRFYRRSDKISKTIKYPFKKAKNSFKQFGHLVGDKYFHAKSDFHYQSKSFAKGDLNLKKSNNHTIKRIELIDESKELDNDLKKVWHKEHQRGTSSSSSTQS